MRRQFSAGVHFSHFNTAAVALHYYTIVTVIEPACPVSSPDTEGKATKLTASCQVPLPLSSLEEYGAPINWSAILPASRRPLRSAPWTVAG